MFERPDQLDYGSGPEDAPLDPASVMRDMQEKIAQHRERIAAARAQAAPAVPAPYMNHDQRRASELAARREARRAQG